jgi:hypothetical protein
MQRHIEVNISRMINIFLMLKQHDDCEEEEENDAGLKTITD